MARDHAAEMAAMHRQFKSGKKRKVLDALYLCVCSLPEKPVPDWAKLEFSKAMHDVAMAKAVSWDDVFGEPHRSRKIQQIRKQRALEWKVFDRVRELRSQRPKPKKINDTVAEEFKIDPRQVKRWFEDVQKRVPTGDWQKQLDDLKAWVIATGGRVIVRRHGPASRQHSGPDRIARRG